MLNAFFLLSVRFFFSYILVDELVLPSPEATSITKIARTAIALPTRLLDGQITRSGCRHKPVLNCSVSIGHKPQVHTNNP